MAENDPINSLQDLHLAVAAAQAALDKNQREAAYAEGQRMVWGGESIRRANAATEARRILYAAEEELRLALDYLSRPIGADEASAVAAAQAFLGVN